MFVLMTFFCLLSGMFRGSFYKIYDLVRNIIKNNVVEIYLRKLQQKQYN